MSSSVTCFIFRMDTVHPLTAIQFITEKLDKAFALENVQSILGTNKWRKL
jgi:hypothetical protein